MKEREPWVPKPYSLIGEPGAYKVLAPWGQELPWPEGASIDFWERLQDLRTLLLAATQDASIATFAKRTLEQADKIWMDRAVAAEEKAKALKE